MSYEIYYSKNVEVTYPLHSHTKYEILYYLYGEGFLKTEKESIPYQKGTIIIVPPSFLHGSTSKNGFNNISISGPFHNLFKFSEPVVMADNEKQEGELLARLICEHRFQNNDFVEKLCQTYASFLLLNLKIADNVNVAISEIMNEISENAFDSNFDVTAVLVKSGYAKDYIRSKFKKTTGKTPTQFLTDIRIKRACYLIEVFNNTKSMTEIAEQCGFEDYIYFSKRFKQFAGCSPNEYRKQIITKAR